MVAEARIHAVPPALRITKGDRLKLSFISCLPERMPGGFLLFRAVVAMAGHGCSAVLKETPPALRTYPGQPVGKLGCTAGD
jgi:hypothetical protein